MHIYKLRQKGDVLRVPAIPLEKQRTARLLFSARSGKNIRQELRKIRSSLEAVKVFSNNLAGWAACLPMRNSYRTVNEYLLLKSVTVQLQSKACFKIVSVSTSFVLPAASF